LTILRNIVKATCLIVSILAVVVILMIGFGFISIGYKAYPPYKQAIVSPYVQDIIPSTDGHKPLWWSLSPLGDKLLYDIESASNQAIIHFLATGQEFTIADCDRFSWLDNEKVYCYDYQNHGYVSTGIIGNVASNGDDFKKSSIKTVTAAQVELATMLKRAKIIYRLQSALNEPGSASLLILNAENATQYYHVTGIKNLDKVLKNYDYTSIFLIDISADLSKKIYSPNGHYYYLLKDNLRIFDAANDQLLVEIKPSSDWASYFQMGGSYANKSKGWASDSSGVFFQIYHPSGFGTPLTGPPMEPIQKLCVSNPC
jgi:hypothetical protein